MIWNHLKIAFRNIVKNKSFTIINLVGLSMGFACALGIFMIVRHEMSYDQFHPNHDKIYRVVSEFRYPDGAEYQSGVPLALPESFRRDFPQVKNVTGIFGGYNNQIDILDGNTGISTKRFKIETGVFYVQPAFFEMFRFKWIAGDPQSVLSSPNQGAITKDLAEQYFGSWQNAMGKRFQKDNKEQVQIAGIIETPPVNTDFPLQIVISYPTLLNSDYGKRLVTHWGTVSSRSQCFIQLADNQNKSSLLRGLEPFRTTYLGKDNKTDFFDLQPLNDIHFNDRYGNFSLYTVSHKTLLSLGLIGVFLLALACINFINLATAQATRRSREVGIRKVLGSARWQLALQFMGETFFLVFVSGLLAMILLNLMQSYTQQIIHQSVVLNPFQSATTIAFTAGILILVTLLAGFYPAWIVSGFNAMEALRTRLRVRSVTGISLRRVLVLVQFVIAQGLIFSTLVVISQLKYFQQSSLGFDKEAILTVGLPRDSVSIASWETYRSKLLAMPGVEKVSLSYSAPSSGSRHTTTFSFDETLKDQSFEIVLNAVDTAYFNTYGLQFLAGRGPILSDTAREIVINETLLKKLGMQKPGEAMGKFIVIDKAKLPIVGVVKDFHEASLRDAIDPLGMVCQKDNYRIAGIKFSPGSISNVMKGAETTFAQTFPSYLYESNFLDESIAKFYIQEKKLSTLSSLFAGVGIVISCMGLYGLILFMTIQRIKEVGIRKTLGASVLNIILLFCKEFIWLVLIAFVIAASVAGFFMSRWLNDFAYHIHIQWWMFAVVAFGSLLLAMMTVSIQTIKAALANPVKSLRAE